MKKLLFLSLTIVFILGLTACGSNSTKTGGDKGSSGGGKTMTLKLSDDQPEDYPTVVGDKAFAKEVEEKTNGRIKIKVYASGQLGAENDVAQQVQLGAVDLIRINGAPLAEFDSDMGVLSMPIFLSPMTRSGMY